MRGWVLVDNLVAALPDHEQRGAALGRPATDDAQRQAVDRLDPRRQCLRQHRSRAARLDSGGRIGAAPRCNDRKEATPVDAAPFAVPATLMTVVPVSGT